MGLTASQLFRARELREAGLLLGRVAELLGVDERLLKTALARDGIVRNEEDFVPDVDGADLSDADDEDRAPPRTGLATSAGPTRTDWPPAPDGNTRWCELPVPTGGASPRVERVRQVELWGKRVWINADHDVWCPDCQTFLPVEVLGRPGNGHQVGVPYTGGIIAVSEEEMLREAARESESALERLWRVERYW